MKGNPHFDDTSMILYHHTKIGNVPNILARGLIAYRMGGPVDDSLHGKAVVWLTTQPTLKMREEEREYFTAKCWEIPELAASLQHDQWVCPGEEMAAIAVRFVTVTRRLAHYLTWAKKNTALSWSTKTGMPRRDDDGNLYMTDSCCAAAGPVVDNWYVYFGNISPKRIAATRK